MGRVNRKKFLKTSAAAAAGVLTAGRAHGMLRLRGPFVHRRERRPNVVVMMTDDQRWDCLSCEGHPFLKTPNMDRIAAEGVRFANMFVTTSLCSPSRATFLSGLYAHTHGVINNFTDYPKDLPSYPRRIQQAGYETAYIGKWHMGEQSDERRPGFDFWMTHKGQGKYFDTTFNINGKRQLLKGYYTHRVTDVAVDWLKRSRRKPFLMILGHKAPHGPFQPEPKYEHIFDNVVIAKPPTAYDLEGKPRWVRERIKTWHGIDGNLYGYNDYDKFVHSYYSVIPSVDDSVGRIFEALREIGELDNTVLVFTSDNGFLLGEHASIDKRTMWEESIRVPMLVRYPELIREPRVVEQMVLNADLAPSLIDICGAEPLEKCHGRSWKKLVQGKGRKWRTAWFYEYNFEKEFPYTPNVRGVRTDQWKYIHYPKGDGTNQYMSEFYNLKVDPLETVNLINVTELADRLNEVKRELLRVMKETDAFPDKMPVNPQLRMELPEESIR